MNAKDLEKLGLTAEAIEKAGLENDVLEKIVILHGKGIEKLKSTADSTKTEAEALKAQLAEANTTIEGFKKLDPEKIKASADAWKTKYEQAQSEATAQLEKVKFDHALERELKETYKVKDPRDVIPNLKIDTIKFSDSGFEGLKDQVEPLKEAKSYLFADVKEPPTVVAGGKSTTVVKDSFLEAAFRGAKLPVDGK